VGTLATRGRRAHRQIMFHRLAIFSQWSRALRTATLESVTNSTRHPCEREEKVMQQARRIAMIRVFVAMVAAISAVALAVPATGVARSRTSADYPVYHVANSGIGVRLRHSPHAGDTYPMGVGPHDGNAFQLVCQDWGDPMGTRDNHIWDYIYWAGYVAWIPDVWTDTPAPANQYSYTHPCPASVGGSGGPVQPPSSGPYMAAAAAVYWCTSLAPLCNASLSLPAGTGVRMACWRD